MGREDAVVRLNNGVGHFGSRVHSKFELALLAVLGREALEKQGAETRSSTTTKRVEDEETLQSIAVIGNTSDTVYHILDHLLANGVMAASVCQES